MTGAKDFDGIGIKYCVETEFDFIGIGYKRKQIVKILRDTKAQKITEKYWTWTAQTNMENIGNIDIKREDTIENIEHMKRRKC